MGRVEFSQNSNMPSPTSHDRFDQRSNLAQRMKSICSSRQLSQVLIISYELLVLGHFRRAIEIRDNFCKRQSQKEKCRIWVAEGTASMNSFRFTSIVYQKHVFWSKQVEGEGLFWVYSNHSLCTGRAGPVHLPIWCLCNH